MRYVLALWALPMGLFWGWFALSYYDLSLGFVMLSRPMHDLVFELYGQMLGIEPRIIPAMVAKACVLDSLVLFAILAFRQRKALGAWLNTVRDRYRSPAVLRADPIHPAE